MIDEVKNRTFGLTISCAHDFKVLEALRVKHHVLKLILAFWNILLKVGNFERSVQNQSVIQE